jgi:hypothetical protein
MLATCSAVEDRLRRVRARAVVRRLASLGAVVSGATEEGKGNNRKTQREEE